MAHEDTSHMALGMLRIRILQNGTQGHMVLGVLHGVLHSRWYTSAPGTGGAEGGHDRGWHTRAHGTRGAEGALHRDDTRVHMVLGVLQVLHRGWHMSAHRGGGGARTEQGLQPALWGDQGLVDAQGKAGEHDRT